MLNAPARLGTWPVSLVLLLGFLVAGATASPAIVFTLGVAAAYAVAAIGVDVISGYGGQPLFGQSAFMAIGAYTSTLVMTHWHLSFLSSLFFAVAACVVVAQILGIPAVRLEHLGFGIVTICFAYLVYVLLTGHLLSSVTQGASGMFVPPGSLFGLELLTEDGFFWASTATMGLALVGAHLYLGSRAGRELVTVKQSPIVAASVGISVSRRSLGAFRVAGAYGGVAGALLAQSTGFLSPESFPATLSVTVFAMAAVGGLGSVSGAIIGAVFFRLFPQVARGLGSYEAIFFAVLFLACLIAFPRGIFGLIDTSLERLKEYGPWQRSRGAAPPAPLPEPDLSSKRQSRSPSGGGSEAPLISAENVTVSFGGVRAIDGVSLDVRAGSIHALVGPNGAGKSTMINALSGIRPPTTGEVLLRGESIKGKSSQAIRRLGVARTFQHPSLVADLTVFENVVVGATAATPTGPLGRLRRPKVASASGSPHRAAEHALELVGVPRNRWTVRGADLSMGEQKLVDFARAVAGPAQVLLLDEPEAGLGPQDLDRVARALVLLLQEKGLGILVISHHINFVRDLADEVLVLDFGRPLARGVPKEVMATPEVVSAFLGSDHAEL